MSLGGTRRRSLALLALGATGAASAGLVAGAWYFANELLDPRRAGDPYALEVIAVDAGSVTLPYTPDTRQPGRAALQWPGGYGLLGDILASPPEGERRSLSHRVGVPLRTGMRARIKRHAVEGDPRLAFGMAFDELSVPGPLGPLPAWLVPGGPAGPAPEATMAILVHGRGNTRPAMLRLLPDVHALGLPAMVVTYRNDVGAPPSPDGNYHLGDTEWQDLQAAVAEARRRGAQRFVVLADSLGGAITLQFLDRSPLAGCVAAVMMDSPVLNWRLPLDLAARQRHLPRLLTAAAKLIARLRTGLAWADFDWLARAHALAVPILLIHGDADITVPVAGSDALARLRPDLVTYLRVPGADHLDAWVVDPAACSAALRSFLAATLTAPDGTPAP